MRFEVKLFAGLREAAGSGVIEVELDRGATAAGLIEAVGRQPGVGDLLQRLPVRVAVNSSYVAGDEVLEDGDEIALVPPISGGSGVSASVTEERLDIAAMAAEAGDPAAGAVVIFQGVTREVPSLEYEAYSEMAENRITEILIECVARFGLTGAVAQHRTGSVPLGEPSVIVAVSAPHRPEAFAGASEAIDRIKAEAPVWKSEIDAAGKASRVEGVLPDPDLAERLP